jgi:hypothetical protein
MIYKRHSHEENIHLRYGFGHNAHGHLDAEEHHQGRGSDFDGDDEHLSHGVADFPENDGVQERPSHGHQFETLHEGLDDDVMSVNGQEDDQGQDVGELAKHGRLGSGLGIDYVHDGEAHLKPDVLAGHLYAFQDQSQNKGQGQADEKFAENQWDKSPQVRRQKLWDLL